MYPPRVYRQIRDSSENKSPSHSASMFVIDHCIQGAFVSDVASRVVKAMVSQSPCCCKDHWIIRADTCCLRKTTFLDWRLMTWLYDSLSACEKISIFLSVTDCGSIRFSTTFLLTLMNAWTPYTTEYHGTSLSMISDARIQKF